MSSPRPVAPRRARPVFQGPTYMAPRYHSRIWGRLIFFIFVLLLAVVVGGGGGLYYLLHRAQSSSSRVLIVHVGPGEGVTAIADHLQAAGLINNTLLFKIDARIQNLGGKLKVGDYSFPKNMSIDQMVTRLQQYTPIGIRFTIPEGWRAEQIASGLTAAGFDGKGFLDRVRHPGPTLMNYLNFGVLRDRPKGAPLEGYLFPNTYQLSPGETPGQIIHQMIRALNQQFLNQPRYMTDLVRQGRSVYDALKLASIVEREARLPLERPVIAGVYSNRLKQGWFLGADPTVQYTAGSFTRFGTSPDAAKKWWPVLQDQAANVNPSSPYNTYTHKGLPPTPIADPGWSSIAASIDPQSTTYMYFVAVKNGHGRHVFARTLQEQTQNIQQYG